VPNLNELQHCLGIRHAIAYIIDLSGADDYINKTFCDMEDVLSQSTLSRSHSFLAMLYQTLHPT